MRQRGRMRRKGRKRRKQSAGSRSCKWKMGNAHDFYALARKRWTRVLSMFYRRRTLFGRRSYKIHFGVAVVGIKMKLIKQLKH